MKYESALLISHVTDLAGPSEAVESYLAARAETLDVIYHPFHYCSDRRSILRRYRNGRATGETRRLGQALPALLTYAKDMLLTFVFFLSLRRRVRLCVACDPLNASAAIILKKLGLIETVIFYTIDWMPERFANSTLNAVYHAMDRFCVRGCDAAWNISPRIVEVRRAQGLPDERNIMVPVGVDLDKIHLPDKRGARPTRLALLGALSPSKGVDLVIEAWPALLARFPDIELRVIGKTPHDAVEDGVVYKPYEPRLSALGPSVTLLGVMSHDAVLATLPDFDLGLALYKPMDNNLSTWADPSRVKDYLACGLPTIITDVPLIARDIAATGAGAVIDYTAEALVRAVGDILADVAGYAAMRQKALEYMRRYDWAAILDASLAAVPATRAKRP